MTTHTSAHAQIVTHFGFALGAGIPVGHQADVVRTGFGGMAFAAIGSNTSPLGIRIDAATYNLQGRTVAGNKVANSNFRSLSLNVVATTTVFRYLKPYALGGVGWYPTKVDQKRENNAGVNAGVGITFPSLKRVGFVEARYHRLYSGGSGNRLIPVTIGILF